MLHYLIFVIVGNPFCWRASFLRYKFEQLTSGSHFLVTTTNNPLFDVTNQWPHNYSPSFTFSSYWIPIASMGASKAKRELPETNPSFHSVEAGGNSQFSHLALPKRSVLEGKQPEWKKKSLFGSEVILLWVPPTGEAIRTNLLIC